MEKFCVFCGTFLEVSAKFCSNCGSTIQGTSEQNESKKIKILSKDTEYRIIESKKDTDFKILDNRYKIIDPRYKVLNKK
jgi:hypothetical protein